MQSSQPAATIFGLLRHGQTVWNKEKRIQGSGDSPLTAEGRVSCRKWGRYLAASSIPWQRIIVSPLQRARETAKLVNETLRIPITCDEGIREQDWGIWEGRTLEQIKNDSPGKLEELILLGWNFRPPGGESRKELLQRVLASLKRSGAQWPGEHLLIISHLGVVKSLLYYLEDRDYLPEEHPIIHNNRLHTIGYRDNSFSVLSRNVMFTDNS